MLVTLAFISRIKHLSSLNHKHNFPGLSIKELYLNQLKIFVISYSTFDMTVPNSLLQL